MSLRFEHVTKRFGTRTVLDDFSLEIPEGQILFILGKSGVGKSVTLKHLVGLLKPDQGQVFVDGEDIVPLGERELGRVRTKCGMVFQHPALFDSLTIYENIAFGLRAQGNLAEARVRAIVLDMMAHVHLDPKILPRKPPEISYGMQKRVSAARTLATGPKFLLFDEPTTGLDPITTRSINDLIQELSRELKVTSVVVSHDMECALSIADQIVVLDAGRILARGTPSEIRASDVKLVQEFLQGIPT